MTNFKNFKLSEATETREALLALIERYKFCKREALYIDDSRYYARLEQDARNEMEQTTPLLENRMLKDLIERLAQIDARQAEMQRTLEGCDWCCGGGDEEWDDLRTVRRQIVDQLILSPEGLAGLTLHTLRATRDQNPQAWDQVTKGSNGTQVCDLWDLLATLAPKGH